jgi:di/tricarboxylate transporter
MMLRRMIPLFVLALLALPATALASEGPKDNVTEFFILLIIGVIALFAVIAGFEARKARRRAGD